MTDHANEDAVIVVGAGIAGLALTRELMQRSVEVVALERYPSLPDAGLAINLPGNAIAALRKLGIGDVRRHGVPVERREYRSSTGRLLFEVDEARFWGDDNKPQCMRRSDLASMLSEGIPEGVIRRQCAVASVSTSERSVAVGTTDGDNLTGKYLVGADGVHSIVRKMCFPGIETSVSQLGQASWRFLAPNPGVDCWTVWMGEHALVLLIPVGPNEIYCWATIPDDEGQSSDPANLLRHIKVFPREPRDAVEAALASHAALLRSPLTEVRMSSWSRGRAILIGDAAHATAPVWAQGGALALEDGLVLAELLATSGDALNVGDEFTRLRMNRIRHVKTMTDRASRISRLPISLRNILMRYAGRLSYINTYKPLRSF